MGPNGSLRLYFSLLYIKRERPTVLAVGAGGGRLNFFSLAYHFSFLLFSVLPLSGRWPDADRNTFS